MHRKQTSGQEDLSAEPSAPAAPRPRAAQARGSQRERPRARSAAWAPRWRMAGGRLADDGCSQELATWVEHALLDDPVRPLQQCLRDCQAECLRRLEIDDQFELRGLVGGEVGWFGTLEDLVHVGDGAKF